MKKARPNLQEQLDEMRASHIADYDFLLDSTESPIERLFLASMLQAGWVAGGFNLPEPIARRLWDDGDHVSGVGVQCAHSDAMGVLQPRILLPSGRRIRADFLFWHDWYDASVPLVVECDGHDFHERTKEQAVADKSRDRELVAMGWRSMRFTGSEIVGNAYRCTAQVTGFLYCQAEGVAR